MIQLKDALHQLENPPRDRSGNPVPAHIECVTCNETQGTGGELLTLDGVVLAKHSGQPTGARRGGAAGSRPANEAHNGTRNFLLVASGEVRKVHVRLITLFNHETVVY